MRNKKNSLIPLKKSFFSLVLALFVFFNCLSQNIFDYQHSYEYGRYLIQSQKYQQAVEEWDRIAFFFPDDSMAKLNLLESMIKTNNFSQARSYLLRMDSQNKFSNLYFRKALIVALNTSDSNLFIRTLALSELDQKVKLKYHFGYDLTTCTNSKLKNELGKWNKIADTRNIVDLQSEILKLKSYQFKSLGSASLLSAVIPGLGKIYAGDWRNGLLSTIVIGANIYQSIRSFNKSGVRSFFGWGYATIALGFYIADVYGSWQTAQDYNRIVKRKIDNELKNYLDFD
jgi:hypothetical protein